MRKQEPSASGWLLFPFQKKKRLSHRFLPQPPFAKGGGPQAGGFSPVALRPLEGEILSQLR